MADVSDQGQLFRAMDKYRQELETLSASLKVSISECVFELYDIADDVDKFHRGATITNVAGSAFGIAGGITSIVGLALAPVTFGASLIVSMVGIAVATAGGITGVTASIADSVNTTQKCKAVNEKLEKTNELINLLGELTLNIQKLATNILNLVERTMGKEQVLNGSRIGGKAVFAVVEGSRLFQLGRISTAAARGAKLAAQGARALRVVSGVFAALFVVIDTAFLVHGSVELHRGAKTETAEKIREIAYELVERGHEIKDSNEILLSFFRNVHSDLILE